MATTLKFSTKTPKTLLLPERKVKLKILVGGGTAAEYVDAFAAFMEANGFGINSVLDAMAEYVDLREGRVDDDELAPIPPNICLPRDLSPEEVEALERAADVAEGVAKNG